MAELEWNISPERPSLRRAIRQRVRELERPCRVAAENILAAHSRMDLLGVGPEGELVSLRIGFAGQDAELLTRALSDLAWLRARRSDLARLVPDLGIEPSAETRAVLLCPVFEADTRAAVDTLAGGRVELITFRAYRHRGQLEVLLESAVEKRVASFPVGASPDTSSFEDPAEKPLGSSETPRVQAARDESMPRSEVRHNREPEGAVGFRTGLTDADLRPVGEQLIDVD